MNSLLKAVLKGSALGAFALVTASVGCSDADKTTTKGAAGTPSSDDGGAAPSSQAGSGTKPSGDGGASPGAGGGESGASTGGQGGAAGTGTGNLGGSDGGEGGAGGAASIPAIARFCNSLTFGTEADPMLTTMILEIGEGDEKVTLTADSFKCAPLEGDACQAIPLGHDVPVTLFDADDPDTALDSVVIDTDSGESWEFHTALDAGSPVVRGGPFTSPECKDLTYDEVFH